MPLVLRKEGMLQCLVTFLIEMKAMHDVNLTFFRTSHAHTNIVALDRTFKHFCAGLDRISSAQYPGCVTLNNNLMARHRTADTALSFGCCIALRFHQFTSPRGDFTTEQHQTTKTGPRLWPYLNKIKSSNQPFQSSLTSSLKQPPDTTGP